jgi:PST family polysaccharide transporter
LAIATQGLKLIVQLTAMSLLARMLGPREFGLWSLVQPIVQFFLVFRDIGLTAATVNSDDITPEEVTSLFWLSVGAGCAIALLLFAAAPLAAAFYAEPRLTAVLWVMASTFVLNSISAQYTALFQRIFRFKALAAVEIGAHVLGTATGVFGALRGYGYWALIAIPVVTQLVQMIATIAISSWQPGRPRWEARTSSMARFGSAITGFNLLNYFARNADNLLIGKYWGMSVLGYYGRAYGLMMAPLYQVIYPLNQVVVPVLTRIRADVTAYTQTFARLLCLVTVVCCPGVTCLLLARHGVVRLLLGPAWGEVVAIFLPLAWAALVQPVNNCAGWVMLSEGRSKDMFVWGLLGGVLTVMSIVGGLPWGARGVAIGYAVVQIAIVTPVLWWFACRGSPVRLGELAKVVLPVWTVCAIAGLAFEALKHRGIVPQAWLQNSLLEIALSGLWVYGVSAALLVVHPRGRALLRTAAAAWQSLRGRTV